MRHHYSSLLTRPLYSSYKMLPFLHPLPFAVEFAISDTCPLVTIPGIANECWERKKKKNALLCSTYVKNEYSSQKIPTPTIHNNFFSYFTASLFPSPILSFLFSFLLFIFILLNLFLFISSPLLFIVFWWVFFCMKVAKTKTSSHQILLSDTEVSGLSKVMWFFKKFQMVGWCI